MTTSRFRDASPKHSTIRIWFSNEKLVASTRQELKGMGCGSEISDSPRLAVSYANFGKLKVETELEQQIWNECSRLITNSIIYYNPSLLSELLKSKEKSGEHDSVELIKMLSPVAWRHINLNGRYEFNRPNLPIDMSQIVDDLMGLDLKQEIIQSGL